MYLKTLAAIVFACVSMAGCGGGQAQVSGPGPARPAQATCPVMGNTFEPSEESEYAEYKGTTYWFCCRGCRGKFLADPEKYLKTAAAPAAPAHAAPGADGPK